jgi:hypothetical protein
VTYQDRLVADANRRFAKIVRDNLDDLPVVELSDGELALQLAKLVGSSS